MAIGKKGIQVATNEGKRLTISISRPTKDVLDQIEHPGQSYEGMIHKLIGLWKRNTEWRKRELKVRA